MAFRTCFEPFDRNKFLKLRSHFKELIAQPLEALYLLVKSQNHAVWVEFSIANSCPDRDNCRSYVRTQHRDDGGSYTQGGLKISSSSFRQAVDHV